MLFLAAVVAPPFCYVMLIRQCRRLGPERLRSIIRFTTAHNVAISLYSAYVSYSTLHKLETSERLYVWTNGFYPLVCQANDGSPAFWYLSKWWEWFDTVILYARGRTPGALHIGHHASTASLVALNLFYRTRPTPVFDVATALNAMVHVIMYAYYAAPHSFRHSWFWVTRAQIAQHVIVLICCISALMVDGCDAPVLPYAVALMCYGYYLIMFVRFYLSRYVASK